MFLIPLTTGPSHRRPTRTGGKAHRGKRRARRLRLEPLEDRRLLSADPSWVFGVGGLEYDQATDVAIDAAGNVYAVGRFNGTVDFDPGPGTAELTSAGGSDAFVAKYSPNGTYLWARQMGGPASDWT